MSRMEQAQHAFTSAVVMLCAADSVPFRRHLERDTDAVRFTLFRAGKEARLRANSFELYHGGDLEALAKQKYHEAIRQLEHGRK